MKNRIEQQEEFLYLEIDYFEVEPDDQEELDEETGGVFVGDLVPDSYAS